MFKTFAVAALVGATQAAEWGNRYTAQQFNVRAPAQKFGVYEPQMLAKTGYRGYKAQVYEPKQKFGVYEPGLKAAVPQYGRPSLDVHAPNQKFGVYEPDFKARAQSYGAPQTEVYEPRQKFGVYEPSLKAGYTRMRTNIHYDQPGAQVAHSRQGPITNIAAGRARYDVLRNSALFDVDSRSAFVIGDRADDRNVRLFGDSTIGHRQSQAFVGRSQKVPNSVRYDNRQADVAVIRGQSKIYGRGDSEGHYQQPRYQAPVQKQVSFGGNYGGYGGYDGGYNGGFGGRVGGYNGGYGGQSYGGYGGQSYGGYGGQSYGGQSYGGYGYGAGQVDRDHDTDRRDNGGENSGFSGFGGDRDPYDQGEYGARYDESSNEGSFGKQVSNQDDDADGDDDDDRGQTAADHIATSDRDVADYGEKGEGNDEVSDRADGIDEVAETRADSYDGGHGHGYGGYGYGRDLGEQTNRGYGGYGGGYGGYRGGYGGGYGGYNGGW